MKAVSVASLSRQRGVVLLVLFMILFMAGSGWLLSALNNNQTMQRRDADLSAALNLAKERLIAYAVLHADYYPATGAGPGHLPCPDTNGDGVEDAPCAAASLGRLPLSYTLPSTAVMPLSDFNSAIDQQFWYAVSTSVKRSPAGVANTASAGSITLDGQTGIAALLIAPGDVVGTQSRVSNTAANYLEAGNAVGPAYVSSNAGNPAGFNDRVLRISIAELMAPVTARVVEVMRSQVLAYQVMTGFYPANTTEFTTAMATAPAWITSNNWLAVTTYTVLSPTTASIQFSACNIVYTLNYPTNTIAKSGARC